MQAYLLWLGFERYRLYTEMKWPHAAYPRTWLTVYISLYAFCIPALLLYLIFGIFKTGNLAGDNDRLAGRTERVVEITRGGAPRPCEYSVRVFMSVVFFCVFYEVFFGSSQWSDGVNWLADSAAEVPLSPLMGALMSAFQVDAPLL